MNLGRTFTTRETPERAREFIGQYLMQAGYEPASPEPALVYKRGSKVGSLLGMSVKSWQVTATMDIRVGKDGLTDVTVSFDVDTTGQMVTKRERVFWEKELDGLVAAVGGMNADVSPLAKVEERLRLEKRFKGGASWFYWIAAMSVLNSLMVLLDVGYHFFIGLGVTQLVDGVASVLVMEVGSGAGGMIRIVAFVIDLLIAGFFALFGLLASRGHYWSFVVGAVLYALDALIFLPVSDFASIGFHGVVLVGILSGLVAGRRLAEGERQFTGPEA